ncbi:MAG: dihydropteroate synthase [Crocinitomicaceae bacterium]|nr:dihydropteroate synthase [Crocinitomicaceae bacterium]|tara:strand:+ start:10021 stop:10872 length:852 start_codon:yes stop_codon:yes gene_type:complete
MHNLNFENTKIHSKQSIRINDKLTDLSTPLIMGIINNTPDSFYSTSRINNINDIIVKVSKMKKEGASIIDVGGYSSRPGAKNISVKTEINRIIPTIELISDKFPNLIISVDTFRSKVADLALKKGAHIINDISGFESDKEIINVASKYNAPYILMHMRGNPKTMQKLTNYKNIFNEIIYYFSKKIKELNNAGVNDIIIDPGFGFSKTIEQNYYLLDKLNYLNILDKPILAGLSRKSMIYKRINSDQNSKETLKETIKLNKICISKGVKILRVHDVKEAYDIIQ